MRGSLMLDTSIPSMFEESFILGLQTQQRVLTLKPLINK